MEAGHAGAYHVPSRQEDSSLLPEVPEDIMNLALLELTQIDTGEVLEQLFVISSTEAATCHPVPEGVVNRIRLYAQVDEGLSGVQRDVRAQLERAALSALTRFGDGITEALNDTSIPFMALWQGGHLQELHGSSLSDSLAMLSHQSGHLRCLVWIQLSAPPPAALTIGGALERQKFRLKDGLADHVQHSCQLAQGCFPEREGPAQAASGYVDTLTLAQQIALEACLQRKALAEGWLSAAQVSARLGSQLGSAGLLAAELRRAGKLLAVYAAEPEPGYRYPTWQFCPDGQPIDQLAEILTLLRGAFPFLQEPDGLRRTTGWGEVEWFLTPHLLLDGLAPASMLATEPARVLQIARAEFEKGL